ncbi:MAG: SMI1/KNR4 family protein [Cytophagales bacterium]|nr:MAG: SMI1/KNR4 family protein [Cytophagales bacterium]
MRNLTRINLPKHVSIEEISNYEGNFNLKLPIQLIDLIENYNSTSVEEALFDSDDTWIINFFLGFDGEHSSITNLTEEINDNGTVEYIPFAMDPGGWHFCFCVNETEYGAIYVFRWTDHSPENAFLKIASGLSEFIDKLYKYKSPVERNTD